MPMIVNIVGAISAKMPLLIFVFPLTKIQGTGFSECAVFGLPFKFTALSALP